MGGKRWKGPFLFRSAVSPRKEPETSSNSTGPVTTTTTVTDPNGNPTASSSSSGITSHTVTETSVLTMTPDDEIIMTTHTETIEGRTTTRTPTAKRRREEANDDAELDTFTEDISKCSATKISGK